MEIHLIRHTRCAVADGLCYGHRDVPLRATAPQDIARCCAGVPQLEIVFSSPLQRCLALASQLSQRDRCELVIDPDLRELDFGTWEGLQWAAIDRRASDHWSADTWHRAPPEGETERALYHRVQRSHEAIMRSAARRVAVVAHAGSLRLLRCLLLQQPIEQRWSWHIEPGAVNSLVVPPSLTHRDAPGILRARDEFPLPGD